MTQTNLEFLKEAQLKINALEHQADDLVDKFNQIVRLDHYKDKDCHWYVQRAWSYGEPDGWHVVHSGYIYEEVDETYSTYYEALNAMCGHLKQALAAELESAQYTLGGGSDDSDELEKALRVVEVCS